MKIIKCRGPKNVQTNKILKKKNVDRKNAIYRPRGIHFFFRLITSKPLSIEQQ